VGSRQWRAGGWRWSSVRREEFSPGGSGDNIESSINLVSERAPMRFVQAVIFLAFLGAVGMFAVQNTNVITVHFWTWTLSGPVALLTIGAYFVGMLSGWTVVAFVRRSLRRVGEHPRA